MEHIQGMEKEMKKQFRDFKSAREFARSLGLKNQKEWKEYCKSGNKPDDIPTNSERTYKKQQTWTSWGDFTGTGRVANQNKIFRSFKESREFVRNIKNLKDLQGMEMIIANQATNLDDIPI